MMPHKRTWKKYYPDKNKSDSATKLFQEIIQAYQTLTTTRQKYEVSLCIFRPWCDYPDPDPIVCMTTWEHMFSITIYINQNMFLQDVISGSPAEPWRHSNWPRCAGHPTEDCLSEHKSTCHWIIYFFFCRQQLTIRVHTVIFVYPKFDKYMCYALDASSPKSIADRTTGSQLMPGMIKNVKKPMHYFMGCTASQVIKNRLSNERNYNTKSKCLINLNRPIKVILTSTGTSREKWNQPKVRHDQTEY